MSVLVHVGPAGFTDAEFEKIKQHQARVDEAREIATAFRRETQDLDQNMTELRAEIATLERELESLEGRKRAGKHAEAEHARAELKAIEEQFRARWAEGQRRIETILDMANSASAMTPDDNPTPAQQQAIDAAMKSFYQTRKRLEHVTLPDVGNTMDTEPVWKQMVKRLNVNNGIKRENGESCIMDDAVSLECVHNPAYRLNMHLYNKETLEGIKRGTKKDPLTNEKIEDWSALDAPHAAAPRGQGTVDMPLPTTDREWDIFQAQIREKCERGIGGNALKKLYNQLVSYYPNRQSGKLFDESGARKVAKMILTKYNIGSGLTLKFMSRPRAPPLPVNSDLIGDDDDDDEFRADGDDAGSGGGEQWKDFQPFPGHRVIRD